MHPAVEMAHVQIITSSPVAALGNRSRGRGQERYPSSSFFPIRSTLIAEESVSMCCTASAMQ